jgi:hypothetical protein
MQNLQERLFLKLALSEKKRQSLNLVEVLYPEYREAEFHLSIYTYPKPLLFFVYLPRLNILETKKLIPAIQFYERYIYEMEPLTRETAHSLHEDRH